MVQDDPNRPADFQSMQHRRVDAAAYLKDRVLDKDHSPEDFARRLVEIYRIADRERTPYFFEGYAVLKDTGYMFIVTEEEALLDAPEVSMANIVSFIIQLQRDPETSKSELVVRFMPLVILDEEIASQAATIRSNSSKVTVLRLFSAIKSFQKNSSYPVLRPGDPVDNIVFHVVTGVSEPDFKLTLGQVAGIRPT
jgi:hypothetical protein